MSLIWPRMDGNAGAAARLNARRKTQKIGHAYAA